MTVRNPLVLIPGGNPQIQELPAGDTLAGAATGPQGPTGATGATGPKGDTGATGAAGADGVDGADGVGVPAGGTAGQVLSKIDGTDYNTQWVDAGGASGSVLLEQHTASSSGSLDFVSISSTYDQYVFELVNVQAATSTANLVMRAGTGAGPTYDTGSNYDWAAVVSNQAGGSGFIGSGGDTSMELAASLGNGSTDAVVGTIKLFVPASTTFRKRFTIQTYYPQSSGNVTQRNGGSTYKSTTAVTAIRFLMSSGNIASGTIRMYGLAK